MRYTTHYDIGESKRADGINEDSVAVTVFEQGHRDGYRGQVRVEADAATDPRGANAADGDESTADGGAAEDGPGDGGPTESTDTADGAANDPPVEQGDPATPPATRSAMAFALADGAGGHAAGDVASYIATTSICESLAPVAIRAARSDAAPFGVDVDDPLPERQGAATLQAAVEDAIVTAHEDVRAYAASADTEAYTTVVAGVLVDGELHYGWVGDSRAYLFNRERGTDELLTKDHSVVEDLQDRGEIDEVEALVHPRGHEITRALGGPGDDPDEASVDVDTNTVPVYAEDVLLVTSDGLVDAQTDARSLYDSYVKSGRDEDAAEEVRARTVTDAEIREHVLGAESLDAAAASLVDLANDRGGKDNLSLLLCRDPSLPSTPDEGMPVRALDPDQPLENRETVIVHRD